jgi:hypothetical protein
MFVLSVVQVNGGFLVLWSLDQQNREFGTELDRPHAAQLKSREDSVSSPKLPLPDVPSIYKSYDRIVHVV